jgi:hypothetical protein
MISLNRTLFQTSAVRLGIAGVVGLTLAMGFLTSTMSAQKRRPARHGVICGNPTVPCKTSVQFPANDLPFRIPANTNVYDTDLFYAVVLKSLTVANDNCDTFIPERDRLAAQVLFPDHKVFSSRCAEPGELFYTNTSPRARFMAVFAGTTLADANQMLATVKATGKFPGANIRRMRAGFNGT